MIRHRFIGIHADPPMVMKWGLASIPFILLIAIYLCGSHMRLKENPSDKLMPSIERMVEGVKLMAFTPDKRTGKYLLVGDTVATLQRFGIGVSLSAVFGLWWGLNVGLFPGLRCMVLPFVTFLSIVPPLAILPILFVVFGVGELSKVMLVFLGTTFFMIREVYRAVEALPDEQISKALTLGATQLGIVYRVFLPQIIPALLAAVQSSLGTIWMFLIAAEAIASTEGLGYRIYLVRRYMAMDMIIPCVLWITFLGYAMDVGLRTIIRSQFPGYGAR